MSLEDQLAQDNKALTKAKAVNSKFASSRETERADLAEAERSLAAALAYEVAGKDSCAQVTADHEVSAKAFTEEVRWTQPQDLDDNPIIQNTQISYLLHANTDVLDGEVSRHQGSDLGRDAAVVRLAPLERVRQRTVEQIIDVPVPLATAQARLLECIVEQIVDVPAQAEQKTLEVPQSQSLDQVIDVPVVTQQQLGVTQ